ncbi:MAG: hypothetical protein AAB389_00180, partial [Patescibacteria group bacterium]
MLEDLIKERLKKKDAREKLGLNVYPARVKRSHLVAHVVKEFSALSKKKTKVWLTGRLLGLRIQGGVAFADLMDGSGGKIQIVLGRQNVPNYQPQMEIRINAI